MASERVFLGWDRPCLHAAARWLHGRFAAEGAWDLGRVLVVTPSSRAGRRLLEILAEMAAGAALTPPTIITAGQLPEKLYRPAGPVADPLRALLTRMHALRQAPGDVLRQVVHQPPAGDDLPGWLALARDLEGLSETLAADGVMVSQVGPLCAAQTDFTEEERWAVLATLQGDYEEALSGNGEEEAAVADSSADGKNGGKNPHLSARTPTSSPSEGRGAKDLHAARFAALRENRCRLFDYEHLILLATADLNRTTHRMVQQLGGGISGGGGGGRGDQESRKAGDQEIRPRLGPLGGVTALIHAPESEADSFDELGCLIVEKWESRHVDLPAEPPERVRVVDRPRDQALEVLRVIERMAKDKAGPPAADQITLGLGDEALAPTVERLLGLAGLPSRLATGQALLRSRPAQLLSAFAAFLASQRFDDLAALLRHPDIEAFLARHGQPPAHENWLTLLDKYLTDHLQGRVSTHWLGDPAKAESLRAAVERVQSLVPADHARPRPLPQWSQALAEVLLGVYGDRPLDRAGAEDALFIHALTQLGDAFREQAALDPTDPATPRVSLAQALQLTLARLGTQAIPPEGGPPAIELLGWLELPLDDAPHLIVMGVNEGHIPQSRGADAFLPDRVRGLLGLADNRRRYARDVLALTAILHGRADVTLIAGRRGGEDEPLVPSRLLLACPDEELPRRVRAFLTPHQPPRPAPLLLAPAPDGRSRFVIPVPRPPQEPLDHLRVTAFRDYLTCPYRFYLKHVLGLKSLRDRVVEMDGLAFGSLAHEVLQQFGAGPLATSTIEAAIAGFLGERLDRAVRGRFGPEPSVAVVIQVHQLRERLMALARWQAQQTREGWRILGEHIEADAQAVLNVDGRPFTITGRIDRIDQHPERGYRLLDYKTGDKGADPDQQHRNGEEWVDLQLPLYRRLAASGLGLEGPVTLGYVQLPRRLEEVGLAEAPWDAAALDAAEAKACAIIRQLREGVFWPPTYPVTDEEFAGICMDEALDRTAALEPGNQQAAEDRAAARRQKKGGGK